MHPAHRWLRTQLCFLFASCPNGSLRFRRVKAPTSAELTLPTRTLARRIGPDPERQGWLTQDAENSYLTGGRARRRSDGTTPGLVDHLPHRRRPTSGLQGVHTADVADARCGSITGSGSSRSCRRKSLLAVSASGWPQAFTGGRRAGRRCRHLRCGHCQDPC